MSTFQPRDLVQVTTYHWETGEMTFRARIVRVTSDTHVQIRTEDDLLFLIPVADCTLISSQEREAA